MRGILAVHPDHEYHAPIEKPETLKPLFAISLAPILYRHHRVIEDRLAVGEINPVLLDIGLTFRLVPGDHMLIVVTTPSLSSFFVTTLFECGRADAQRAMVDNIHSAELTHLGEPTAPPPTP
jgi:hypothetical protein